jgi:rubrerythrin
LTVQSDLQKAVASAQSAKGTYLMAASSTEDTSAKQRYEAMAGEMDSHLSYLSSRLQYLNSSNSFNQSQID